MTGARLVDQEFVVHVFAPVEGPLAAQAHDQIDAMWTACRDGLGMTEPIPGVGLPTDIPGDWLGDPASRALAAREHPGADYQAILRREHDVLNLSVMFAPPQDGAGPEHTRRLRVGSASPPGWIEFDRWWDEVAAAGTGALLGVARLYQAKAGLYQAKAGTGPTAADHTGLADAVRGALPHLEDEDGWWERGAAVNNGLSMWELSPRLDTRAQRRLVVVAPTDRDPQLSAFTWSRGDPAMPPLARYLMHAAKMRYQLRVWTDGQRQVEQVRRRLADRVAQAHSVAVATMAGLREMRLAVEIAADNMGRAVDGQVQPTAGTNPVADDRALADWFTQQLSDAISFLDIALTSAGQIAEITSEPVRGLSSLPLALAEDRLDQQRVVSTVRGGSPPHVAVRMGFAVDVVGYSTRSGPAKEDAQRRVAAIVGEVLRDIRLDIADTDHQGTGDGINVFLPADVEIHRALPHLIRATAQWLAHDNGRYNDRLRLRMAASVGPVGLAALGYSGNTIIHCGRLVDSQPLRDAMTDHPDIDLAILISDTLYSFIVDDGHPGLHAAEFRCVEVKVKEFHKQAWLWEG